MTVQTSRTAPVPEALTPGEIVEQSTWGMLLPDPSGYRAASRTEDAVLDEISRDVEETLASAREWWGSIGVC